jgi:hypothetical protein
MLAPAPWQLRAQSYLLALKHDREQPFARAPELADARSGPLAWVMFVDYAEAPVGPYRELLYIPGTFRFGREQLPSITKIYVSTQASVDNGRRNWAIPKELATFDVAYGADGVDRVHMQVAGQRAVELAFRPGMLGLPVASWLLPRAMRSLGQRLDGRTLVTRPRGRASIDRARLLEAWSDERYFPALTRERVFASVKLRDVALTFPEAERIP